MRSISRVLIISFSILVGLALAGCKSKPPTRAQEPEVEYKVATREELLANIVENTQKILTLQARATVRVVDVGIALPENRRELLKAKAGKAFRKMFPAQELSGSLLYESPPEGHRKIRLHGEFLGSNFKLYMLGQDDEFAILIPPTDPDDTTQGTMLRGMLNRFLPRPLEVLTARPQDLSDLLLYDYLRSMKDLVVGMEVWRDQYVIQVLHPQRRELIFSKIWVDRATLRVQTHQLFDADGTLICEARFDDYRRLPVKEKAKVEVELPMEILFIWPKEDIDIGVRLSRVKLNEPIDPKYFKPYESPRVKTMWVEQKEGDTPHAEFRPKRKLPSFKDAEVKEFTPQVKTYRSIYDPKRPQPHAVRKNPPPPPKKKWYEFWK